MSEPIELAVFAVLNDTVRHGMDSEPGVEALDRGIRDLLARYKPYEVVGVAMCGWAGMVEAIAEHQGVDPTTLVGLYAATEAPA